jgi:hypothetical protein
LAAPLLPKVFDLVPAMIGEPSQITTSLPAHLAQEHTQETYDGCGIIGGWTHLHEQSPIEGDATDGAFR